jgi:acyl-CoA thioesterase-1
VYPDLAGTYRVPLIPFLLEGVAGDAALNQADGIHPNPEGARRVADTVWKTLEPLLTSTATS